jgi:hypothetical protein
LLASTGLMLLVARRPRARAPLGRTVGSRYALWALPRAPPPAAALAARPARGPAAWQPGRRQDRHPPCRPGDRFQRCQSSAPGCDRPGPAGDLALRRGPATRDLRGAPPSLSPPPTDTRRRIWHDRYDPHHCSGCRRATRLWLLRRFIVVPCNFPRDSNPPERELALAHECAHHARGDLSANRRRPSCWLRTAGTRSPGSRCPPSARIRRWAPRPMSSPTTIGLNACFRAAFRSAQRLSAHRPLQSRQSQPEGRLMTIGQTLRPRNTRIVGAAALALTAGAALVATAAPSPRRVRRRGRR